MSQINTIWRQIHMLYTTKNIPMCSIMPRTLGGEVTRAGVHLCLFRADFKASFHSIGWMTFWTVNFF